MSHDSRVRHGDFSLKWIVFRADQHEKVENDRVVGAPTARSNALRRSSEFISLHSSPNGDYLEIFRIHKCDFIAPSIVVGP